MTGGLPLGSSTQSQIALFPAPRILSSNSFRLATHAYPVLIARLSRALAWEEPAWGTGDAQDIKKRNLSLTAECLQNSRDNIDSERHRQRSKAMEFFKGRLVQNRLGSVLCVRESQACESKLSIFRSGTSEYSWLRVCWLKFKRPANSLSCMALSWPLELQMGYASLNGAER